MQSAGLTLPLYFFIIAAILWIFSQWWEKGLAKQIYSPETSQDNCYRVETLKPFWILPSFLHPQPHPGEENKPAWFRTWVQPGFFRLYDNKNNVLISETAIYDLGIVGGKASWGSGSDWIMAGIVLIGQRTLDCPPGPAQEMD